jgi:hypothetical protein
MLLLGQNILHYLESPIESPGTSNLLGMLHLGQNILHYLESPIESPGTSLLLGMLHLGQNILHYLESSIESPGTSILLWMLLCGRTFYTTWSPLSNPLGRASSSGCFFVAEHFSLPGVLYRIPWDEHPPLDASSWPEVLPLHHSLHFSYLQKDTMTI